MKAYCGVELQVHSFFYLGTRWRWVISFMPRPLYTARVRILKPHTNALSPFTEQTTVSRCLPHTYGNVKLSLWFKWEPRLESVLEWSYNSTHSFTSTLDGGEWSASRPDRFTPKERTSGAHWIEGWVGPRAGLDVVVKRKIPRPCRDSIFRSYSP